MRLIPLTQGKFAKVDNEDYERVSQYKWQAHIEHGNYYACTSIINNGQRTTLRMPRFILNAQDGQYVDHIDHDGLNNQKNNIRLCTPQQNNYNKLKQPNKTSKYKGVSKRKNTGKYESYIVIGGKRKHLGFYKSEIEAALKYDEMAKIHYGEFANLNFSENTDITNMKKVEEINKVIGRMGLNISKSERGKHLILINLYNGSAKGFENITNLIKYLSKSCSPSQHL